MGTPIVFAMDDNYAMPTAVALYSILKHTKETALEFYVLYSNSLSDISKEMLDKALERAGRNASLNYINVDGMLDGLKSSISHISVATFYRILLPLVLNEYDSCLYLDGDIVAVDDIGKLLSLKLSDQTYVAGVKTVMLQTAREKVKKQRMSQLGIDDIEQYINAGVTLLNLKALRDNDCVRKMIDLIPKGFPLQDQDIINKVCYKKTMNLPPRYNVMPITLNKWSRRPSLIYGKDELKQARNSPCIIHYADKNKPWRYDNIPMVELWDEAYKDLFSGQLLHREKVPFSDKVLRNVRRVANSVKRGK